jgi:hypothetical protein
VASDTKNVKLGACSISFGGNDLGYTQGGSQVTVKTDTHEVNVDQFGKSIINETITARSVSVKTQLAETTLQNLVATMPGASLTTAGGAAASGSIGVSAVAAANDTLTVNGTVFTFKAAVASATDILVGASVAAQATAIAAALSASTVPAVAQASYVAGASVVTVTADAQGTAGNSFTLATSAAGKLTVPATLTGGVQPTSASVDVDTGIGVDLLSIAQELRLHPISKGANDYSEDFVIPLAATPGSINFAYEVDKERVYDVEFTGFPDPVTKRLFRVGTAPGA